MQAFLQVYLNDDMRCVELHLENDRGWMVVRSFPYQDAESCKNAKTDACCLRDAILSLAGTEPLALGHGVKVRTDFH